MNATKNTYTTLHTKRDYSTFYYIVIFIVAAASLGGGGFWLHKHWEKKEAARIFEAEKNLVFNTQNEKPTERESRKETPFYEKAHSQIRGNHRRAKKLTSKVQENPQHAKWEPVLEQIKQRLNKEEDLKTLKGLEESEENWGKQVLEEFYLQTFQQGKSLERLSSKIIPIEEIQQQIKAQNNWLLDVEKHKSQSIEPIKELIDHFYQLFLNQLDEYEKTPWWWEVEVIQGKPVKNNTPQQRWANYNYIKSRQPDSEKRVKKLNWQGFTGFLPDDYDKGKEGANTLGLTTSERDAKVWVCGKDKFSHATENNVRIELKKELLFNRQNKYYDEWLSDLESENGTWKWMTLDISEENLINTIAHELAHAVIDNTHLIYKPENGGHGPLHDEYTERIEKLILEDKPRYEEFMAWWREPRTANDQN